MPLERVGGGTGTAGETGVGRSNLLTREGEGPLQHEMLVYRLVSSLSSLILGFLSPVNLPPSPHRTRTRTLPPTASWGAADKVLGVFRGPPV